ncbi:DUF4411 family protein [Ruoffia tabacinasalis]|uniref:DUF4411 family protein n=1 Tax=Ruoffia tabacinasalis TaxID=87458 RepID=A0A5R9DVL2_9LACT|nr:DUF4411 family protein [Ruoffia tabacinasalis]TLQ40933.1 DUF4411 family protein [Ruoffia tabacinasalis]
MTKYLLDTNIYLDFYDRYYKFNYFPSFWLFFEDIINKSVVIPKIVLNEQFQDEKFNNWITENYTNDIINHKDFVIGWTEVLSYLQNSPFYNDKALTSDKGWAHERIADPWLIAIAKDLNLTLVTSETRNVNLNISQPSKSAKIPDVCDKFEVACININTFFEEINLEI